MKVAGDFILASLLRRAIGISHRRAAKDDRHQLRFWLAGLLMSTRKWLRGPSSVSFREAARDLPNANTVLDLLDAHVNETASTSEGEVIEDHFWIERIEPGKPWLKPLTVMDSVIGPITVPPKVTQLCQTMWDIGGAVTKTGDGWQFVEVWNVSP
jgi:hypothetical protein